PIDLEANTVMSLLALIILIWLASNALFLAVIGMLYFCDKRASPPPQHNDPQQQSPYGQADRYHAQPDKTPHRQAKSSSQRRATASPAPPFRFPHLSLSPPPSSWRRHHHTRSPSRPRRSPNTP
ncbi:hypothetical protein ACUNIZ_25835, partial [Serratia sp. IR-2025]